MKNLPNHRLRTLSLVALGLLTGLYFHSPAEVGGADWKFIENDGEGLWFFDSETMQYLSDRLVRVQTKKIYKEKAVLAAVDKYGKRYEDLDHVLAEWELDCFQKRFKLCSAVFFSKENAVIERYPVKKEDCLAAGEIPPDSYMELLRKKVCR
jgi:integrase